VSSVKRVAKYFLVELTKMFLPSQILTLKEQKMELLEEREKKNFLKNKEKKKMFLFALLMLAGPFAAAVKDISMICINVVTPRLTNKLLEKKHFRIKSNY